MEFKYPTPDDVEVWLDGERHPVAAGERIEVTGDQAKQLESQGWIRVDKPQSRTNTKDGE